MKQDKIIDEVKSHPYAIELHNRGICYSCSTTIDYELAFGYGILDTNGFWEFPLYFEEKNN
jgi:hypothetical protein